MGGIPDYELEADAAFEQSRRDLEEFRQQMHARAQERLRRRAAERYADEQRWQSAYTGRIGGVAGPYDYAPSAATQWVEP